MGNFWIWQVTCTFIHKISKKDADQTKAIHLLHFFLHLICKNITNMFNLVLAHLHLHAIFPVAPPSKGQENPCLPRLYLKSGQWPLSAKFNSAYWVFFNAFVDCGQKILSGTKLVSNNLDPDQDLHSVSPHLGPNCLQRFISTSSKSGKLKDMQEKESVKGVRKNLSLWITIISASYVRLKAHISGHNF